MKKLTLALAAFAISAVATTNVIACGGDEIQDNNDKGVVSGAEVASNGYQIYISVKKIDKFKGQKLSFHSKAGEKLNGDLVTKNNKYIYELKKALAPDDIIIMKYGTITFPEIKCTNSQGLFNLRDYNETNTRKIPVSMFKTNFTKFNESALNIFNNFLVTNKHFYPDPRSKYYIDVYDHNSKKITDSTTIKPSNDEYKFTITADDDNINVFGMTPLLKFEVTPDNKIDLSTLNSFSDNKIKVKKDTINQDLDAGINKKLEIALSMPNLPSNDYTYTLNDANDRPIDFKDIKPGLDYHLIISASENSIYLKGKSNTIIVNIDNAETPIDISSMKINMSTYNISPTTKGKDMKEAVLSDFINKNNIDNSKKTDLNIELYSNKYFTEKVSDEKYLFNYRNIWAQVKSIDNSWYLSGKITPKFIKIDESAGSYNLNKLVLDTDQKGNIDSKDFDQASNTSFDDFKTYLINVLNTIILDNDFNNYITKWEPIEGILSNSDFNFEITDDLNNTVTNQNFKDEVDSAEKFIINYKSNSTHFSGSVQIEFTIIPGIPKNTLADTYTSNKKIDINLDQIYSIDSVGRYFLLKDVLSKVLIYNKITYNYLQSNAVVFDNQFTDKVDNNTYSNVSDLINSLKNKHQCSIKFSVKNVAWFEDKNNITLNFN